MLGGLISLRDKHSPPGARAPAGGNEGLRRLRLHVWRLAHRRARVRVLGGGTRLVRRVDFVLRGRRAARDRRRPFRRVIRVGPRRVRVRARIVLVDGRRVVRTRTVRRARANG